MIISNGTYDTKVKQQKQKPFIFLNPPQTGGFIVEMALEQHLRVTDIITPHKPYIQGQNYSGFYTHMNASEVHKKIKHNYDALPKITVIRNPWELVMNLYENQVNHIDIKSHKKLRSKEFFKAILQKINYSKDNRKFFKEIDEIKRELEIKNHAHSKKPRTGIVDFFTYSIHMPTRWNKYEYYFFNGEKSSTTYLNYDNLQKDFNKFCKEFNIPQTKLEIDKLPRIDEKKFCIENIKRHVINNPKILHEKGIRKSDDQLHSELSNLISAAAGKIHWNYEILLDRINKKNKNGKQLKESIEVKKFKYAKITTKRIDDIVTTYLNQKST